MSDFKRETKLDLDAVDNKMVQELEYLLKTSSKIEKNGEKDEAVEAVLDALIYQRTMRKIRKNKEKHIVKKLKWRQERRQEKEKIERNSEKKRKEKGKKEKGKKKEGKRKKEKRKRKTEKT